MRAAVAGVALQAVAVGRQVMAPDIDAIASGGNRCFAPRGRVCDALAAG